MEKRSQVKNAADESQVRRATEKQENSRDFELADLESVMSTPAGRRFIWRVLERCKVFGTVWDGSARIHYNSGQQDIGHWVMAEVGAADEDALFLMMKEAKHRELNDV
jgi:hypothetical protein